MNGPARQPAVQEHRPRSRVRALGVVTLWACGAWAVPAPCARAQVSLPAQPDLARLVDLSAQRLNLRVTYDETALKGKVTLRQDHPLSDGELWRLTNRLLADAGFTTIRAGDDDTIAVVKLQGAAHAARVERVEDVSAEIAADRAVAAERGASGSGAHDGAAPGPASPGAPARPGFRRVMVPLQRASSKDVLSAVQLVLSKPGGSAAEAEQAGLLMLADLTPHLEVALRLIEQLDGAEGGASVREIPARNVDPTRLATLAKQLADKRKSVGGREIRGEVIPAAGGTGLLLIAPPALISTWEAIITSVDQREAVERRTYGPGSFGMKEVASLIEQTVRSGPGGSGGGAGAVAGGGTDDRWRIVLDDLTGTLIITATPSQHEQIGELLARLASVPAESRRPVRTFKIRNRGVKEVQQVIEDLMHAGVLEAQAVGDAGDSYSTPGPIGSQNTPQTSPRSFGPGTLTNPASNSGTRGSTSPLLPGNLGQGSVRPSPPARVASTAGGSPALTLTSDEATNTLIAVGEPRLLAQLEHLLPTLDIRQPQVMLEAILVSLSDTQSLSLGVELERLQISGETLIRLSSLFGLSTASGSGANATRTVGDSAGFTGAVLNPGDFSIVIRAIETINQGRSLSNPRVLVNNNQQASFNSVLQQPFASTNASSTVSTTSFGGTQDAGTTISVKPQIAEGDHLVLTYSVSLSSFVGAAASSNLPPPRQQNSVQSVATIPDGYTVVVGGLELTTEGEGTTQVPILGSIPIIGEAFKNRSNSRGRQRFYVFLRASVLRQPNLEDLKYLSDVQMQATGVEDGWPEVEPRIIGGGGGR